MLTLCLLLTKMARTGSGRNEDALSEIVGFVLILALVVVASTLYLMYVVPAEGREDEIEHMNQVQDRFVSYKTSVDGLWMRSLADLSVPGTRGVSLSTSFDLGTGGGNTQSSGLFLSFMRPIGTAAKMRTQLDTTPSVTRRTTGSGSTVDGVDQFSFTDRGLAASRSYIPHRLPELPHGQLLLDPAELLLQARRGLPRAARRGRLGQGRPADRDLQRHEWHGRCPTTR